MNGTETNGSWVRLRLLTSFLAAILALPNAVQGEDITLHDCVVRFADEVEVPALATGSVDKIEIKQNQVVEQGIPLARLDDRSLLIRRRTAQLNLATARADTESDIQLNYARMALKEANADLKAGLAIHEDMRGALALNQMGKLRLAVTRGEFEVQEAEKKIKQALIQVQLREAELELIDDEIRRLHVNSPIAGVVLDVHKSEGEWVAAGETLATIARIDRLHIHALVSQDQLLPSRCVGLPVSVHWQQGNTQHSLRGKIASVDPQLLPNGQYRIHAEIENENIDGDRSKWKLYPGANVRTKIYISAATASVNPPRLNR